MLCSLISLAIELSMHCEQSYDMTGTAVGRADMPAYRVAGGLEG